MISSASTGAPADSIAGVAARLRSWLELKVNGIVLVRYVSDTCRDEVLRLMDPSPRLFFQAPNPQEAFDWLNTRLEELAKQDTGSVSVVFPHFLPEPDWIVKAFGALNLRREHLFGLHLAQIWWIPAELAAEAEAAAPDLASWFRLKLWLNELPSNYSSTQWVEVSRESLAAVHASTNPEQALVDAERSVQLHREAMRTNPEAAAGLIAALSGLSIVLQDLGRNTEALLAAEEAVSVGRHLAAAHPGAFKNDLASALAQFGNVLGTLGQRDAALAAADECLRLFRQLADEKPGAHLSGLGAAWNNYGNRLSDVGRYTEALAAAEQSLALSRQFFSAQPAAFNDDLSVSLINIASKYARLGRLDDAVAASQEAVQLLQSHRSIRSQNQKGYVATALINLAGQLIDIGRADEAASAALKAVELSRPLVETSPAVFEPLLAGALTVAAGIANDTGHPQTALELVQESVDILRKLTATKPGGNTSRLAAALATLGQTLLSLSRFAEAADILAEGIRRLSPVFINEPEVFRNLMADLLAEYRRALHSGAHPRLDDSLLAPILQKLNQAS